jgi:hypothetical protein
MQVAVRSYLIAGVAAVGATAIALAPIQPILPDVQIPSSHVVSVDLAATVNPIEAWVQVIQGAVTNVGGLVDQVVATPFPVTGQLIDNQLANFTLLGDTAQATVQALVAAAQALPAALQAAGQQLAAGEIVNAFNTLVLYSLQAALPLVGGLGAAIQITQNAVQNIANVIGVIPDAILAAGLGAISPVISTMTAGAQTIQDVIDAAGTGDFAGALGTLINTPATLTGAFLNGYPTSFFPAGLLSQWTGSAFDSGPIGIALALRDEIAAALFPVGHQPTAQAAAPNSASVQRTAAIENDTAPAGDAPHAAGPKPTKTNGSGRFAAHGNRSAGADVQAASAGDAPKDTSGAAKKAGQKRSGKAGSSRHEKAAAGADK